MIDLRKDENNHYEFKSNFQILLQFLCSIIQLICILTILCLQIFLIITNRCFFHIGYGFWSVPFLIIAPISVWIFLCKRNLFYCCLVIIIHMFSNLFTTIILILNILIYIKQIGTSCSILNDYSVSFNISIIILCILLKIFFYGEIFLVYIVGHKNQKISILLRKNFEIIFDKPNRKTWKLLQLEFNRLNYTDI
ncbi:unnamed protein product [Adineta steineri]|uniref:Transmembrane protein n=1 Tax=Adineta steineri TaxID=433720 RepID=A0A813R5G2_9BILA|nr:unnamed protein product [Adineta steineri]CAF0845740.1 unnamed protein product [Adineta steineri]CAF3499529.1 unnamed protein product [Adineta steineri]